MVLIAASRRGKIILFARMQCGLQVLIKRTPLSVGQAGLRRQLANSDCPPTFTLAHAAPTMGAKTAHDIGHAQGCMAMPVRTWPGTNQVYWSRVLTTNNTTGTIINLLSTE